MEKPAPFSSFAELVKANSDKQYTLCPILVPDVVDTQDDVLNADEIEKAIWGMGVHGKLLDLEHYYVDASLGEPVEKYVMPVDAVFPLGEQSLEAQAIQAQISELQQQLVSMGAGRLVRKGSGMLGCVWKDAVWKLIKSGEFKGMSIAGRGHRTPTELEDSTNGEG